MSQTGVASTGLRRQASSSRIVTSSRRSSHLWEWRCAGRPYSSPNSTSTTERTWRPVGLLRRPDAPARGKSSRNERQAAAGSLRSAPHAGRCDRRTRDWRSAARPSGTGPHDCRATRHKDRSGRTRATRSRAGAAWLWGRAARREGSGVGRVRGDVGLTRGRRARRGWRRSEAGGRTGPSVQVMAKARRGSVPCHTPVRWGAVAARRGGGRRRGLAGAVSLNYPAFQPGKPSVGQGNPLSSWSHVRAS